MTQTDLYICLELERASVGHVVDQLESMVLAERRAAKGDRRVWELHLLPRAIEILPQLRAEADMIYARLLHMISPTEIRAMRRSEENTSELQSLMRSSYAVFFLKHKN